MPATIRRRTATLFGRVLLAAGLILAVAAPVIWFGAGALIRAAAEGVVDAQLRGFGNQLRAARASEQASGVFFFNEPDLEWVWQISIDGAPVNRATVLSLSDRTLPSITDTPARDFAVDFADSAIGRLRLAERLVEETDRATGALRAVRYQVGIRQAKYEGLVDDYVAQLQDLVWYAAVPAFVGLIGISAVAILMLRGGLNEVRRAIDRFRSGATERIEGRHAAEMQVLVDQVNELLERQADMLGRSRKYVAKIAHDLNHPIAIVGNAVAGSTQQPLIDKQLARMRGLIDRYSALARAIGPGALTVRAVALAPILEDVADSHRLLFRRAPLTIDVDCPPELRFAIEPADAEAMLSNLVGNAHKFAAGRVRLSARAGDGGGLVLAVEDDGPGIAPQNRAAALRWGEQLDEAPPGSGFGLAIVQDLAQLYGGGLTLADSPLGGLRAEIALPAAAGAGD
ncbi:MAG: HAMP domain-containing sensor histidine kinase [Alphaproteobacteria bacterium]